MDKFNEGPQSIFLLAPKKNHSNSTSLDARDIFGWKLNFLDKLNNASIQNSSMDMYFLNFVALQINASRTSQCVQLNFGGGRGSDCSTGCTLDGKEMGKTTWALRQKMDAQTVVWIEQTQRRCNRQCVLSVCVQFRKEFEHPFFVWVLMPFSPSPLERQIRQFGDGGIQTHDLLIQCKAP